MSQPSRPSLLQTSTTDPYATATAPPLSPPPTPPWPKPGDAPPYAPPPPPPPPEARFRISTPQALPEKPQSPYVHLPDAQHPGPQLHDAALVTDGPDAPHNPQSTLHQSSPSSTNPPYTSHPYPTRPHPHTLPQLYPASAPAPAPPARPTAYSQPAQPFAHMPPQQPPTHASLPMQMPPALQQHASLARISSLQPPPPQTQPQPPPQPPPQQQHMSHMPVQQQVSYPYAAPSNLRPYNSYAPSQQSNMYPTHDYPPTSRPQHGTYRPITRPYAASRPLAPYQTGAYAPPPPPPPATSYPLPTDAAPPPAAQQAAYPPSQPSAAHYASNSHYAQQQGYPPRWDPYMYNRPRVGELAGMERRLSVESAVRGVKGRRK